jgi:hypothetical protein
MTVKELIDVLSTIEDQNLRVVIKGYERGYEDIEFPDNTPLTIDIALNVNPQWYYGNHERVSPAHHQYGDHVKVVKAVLI